jgi:hypothetical protein
MSFDYHVDPIRGLVISRAWGILTDQDLLAHPRALAEDPLFRPSMNQLTDFREVTDFRVESATIHRIAGLSPFGAGARRALLVGSESLYGMARMYQILRDTAPDDLQVFRELDAALEWLGLKADADVLAALAAPHPRPGPA